MRLSRAPDLGAPHRMALAGLVATLGAALILILRDAPGLVLGLGDTDDALRIVLMRDLLAGRGWFDQLVTRLQPPLGLQSHWSRLIDGGLAGLTGLFRLGLSPDKAELATRIVWPLLWIFPAALAALVSARRLAGGAAVFACAVLLLTDLSLYLQFRPGRVDHHGVQIALFMVALGGAAMGSVRGAILAGAAIGLGLAAGLEALMFAVAVAAFFPLAFLIGKDADGRRLRAFALALGAVALIAFLAQTPPARWNAVACDAMAANLVAGVLVGALGLLAAVHLTRDLGWRGRLVALALTGAAAAGLYLALHPHCLAGPFADVDPQLKSFWLPHVQEVHPIPRTWARDPAIAFTLMAPPVFGVVAWLWLGRSSERRADPFWILAGVCLTLATVAGFSAVRMATYANWIAIPIIAAAVTDLVERRFGGRMIVLAAAACLATPLFTAGALAAADKRLGLSGVDPAPKERAGGDPCFQSAAYAALARQPAGLVLGELDLGPFILAHTESSALAAPYHRMNWGLIAARRAMTAEAEAAEAEARALGVDYVLACPAHADNADRAGLSADSLQRRVDAGAPPSWLEPIGSDGPLRLYRVRPEGSGD